MRRWRITLASISWRLEHFTVPFPPESRVGGNPDYTAQQKANPNPIQWYWRALITDMDQWAKDGKEPPPSTYPRIAEETLVPLAKWSFPKIPGVNKPREVAWPTTLIVKSTF